MIVVSKLSKKPFISFLITRARSRFWQGVFWLENTYDMVGYTFQQVGVVEVVLGFRNVVSRPDSDEVETKKWEVVLRLYDFHFAVLATRRPPPKA